MSHNISVNFLEIAYFFPSMMSKLHIVASASRPCTSQKETPKKNKRRRAWIHTCVWRGRGGGLYDRSAVVGHEELASALGVQRRQGRRARSSVPPVGPPMELQVQGLV